MNGPNIVSVSIDPPNPKPFETYTFTAEFQCVDNDDSARLYVKGSDNYLSQQKCYLPKEAKKAAVQCSIRVAGGDKKTKDKAWVEIAPADQRSSPITASIQVSF